MNKITAIVLIALGAFLLYWGYDEYNALSSQVNQLVSGKPTTKSIMILAAGGISLLFGVIQAMRK
jgi:uncharacterized membrane protein